MPFDGGGGGVGHAATMRSGNDRRNEGTRRHFFGDRCEASRNAECGRREEGREGEACLSPKMPLLGDVVRYLLACFTREN